mmetsp:Transcript_23196/g.51431  ORF Transcript_23196/g.51431 Transcript_23196/m.51431 type:complete len:117 (+) Transcript_23196:231-581(+)
MPNNNCTCRCHTKDEEQFRVQVAALGHDERLALARRQRSGGYGMVVAGFGCMAGLTGGLWSSIGPAAIAVGFGAASGLLFASCGRFGRSDKILAWDEEIENGAAPGDGGADTEDGV